MQCPLFTSTHFTTYFPESSSTQVKLSVWKVYTWYPEKNVEPNCSSFFSLLIHKPRMQLGNVHCPNRNKRNLLMQYECMKWMFNLIFNNTTNQIPRLTRLLKRREKIFSYLKTVQQNQQRRRPEHWKCLPYSDTTTPFAIIYRS